MGWLFDDQWLILNFSTTVSPQCPRCAYVLHAGDVASSTPHRTEHSAQRAIEVLLVDRGLEVADLTEQTRLSVASDPDSVKARAACDYPGADRRRDGTAGPAPGHDRRPWQAVEPSPVRIADWSPARTN